MCDAYCESHVLSECRSYASIFMMKLRNICNMESFVKSFVVCLVGRPFHWYVRRLCAKCMGGSFMAKTPAFTSLSSLILRMSGGGGQGVLLEVRVSV